MSATGQLTTEPRPDRALLPGVVVGVSPYGPLARPVGTRLDVWFLLDTLAELGSCEAVTEHFGVPVEVIWAAIEYDREFPDRVAAERAAAQEAERDVERRYSRAV